MKTGVKVALGAGVVIVGFIVVNKMRGGGLVQAPQPTMTPEEQMYYPNGADSPAREPNPWRQYVRGTPGSRM